VFLKYKKWLLLATVALIPILSGCDGCDKKKYVAPPPAPSAPSNLSGNAVSSTQINLSWKDNSTNEKGFYLYRRTTNSYARVAILEVNANSYNDMSLNPETSYWYKVRAYNDGGESGSSNEVNITTPAGPVPPSPELEAPSNLSTNVVSYKQINLSWRDNSDTEDGFRVRCNIDHTRTKTIATVGRNTTQYEHCKLQPMTHHKYYIEVFRGEETAGSPQVSATTPCPIQIVYSELYRFAFWEVEVFGAVENNATEACIVQLTATFYDKSGDQMESRTTNPFTLSAGQSYDFSIRYQPEDEPTSDNYDLEVTRAEIIY